jgi:diguanylate cyclase (GGDEF)-like protein/PAS domain S-box-containing protein
MRDDPGRLIAKAMDLLLDAVCIVDRDGIFVFVGGASERVFGYTAQEMIGQPMIDFVHPEDREMTLRAASEIMAGTPKTLLRNRYLRKDGTTVHIMWSAQSSSDGMRFAVARDISPLVRIEALQAALYAISEAAHAAEDLPSLFRHLRSIVGRLVPEGDLFLALCHQDSETLGPTFPYDEGRPEGSHVTRAELEQACAEILRAEQARVLHGEPAEPAPVVERRDERGHLLLGVPLRARASVIGALLLSRTDDTRDAQSDKELLQFVSTQIATAIERKQSQLRLRHMALYDSLTDLPNRDLVEDRLTTARLRARRNRVGAGLLFIDLDGFKSVNDTLGHAAGDQLLQQVADRLRRSVRDSDTVARLGGDEFIAVLDGVSTAEHALIVANRICAALVEPFDVAGHRVSISSSIGVALYPDHGSDNQSLIRCADQAMYQAKSRGKNGVCVAVGRA